MKLLAHPIDRVWLLLAVATAVTWAVGEFNGNGGHGFAVVAFVFALAVAKGAFVILDFMELRHAPVLWLRLALGWLVFVTACILIAYRSAS